MRRAKPRSNLLRVVLALIILPPLGLFMLWRSPRVLRVKIIISIIFVLLAGGAVAGIIKSGILGGAQEPPGGYDVTLDSRGRYRTQEIFPFERTIFNAVVREMRKLPAEHVSINDELTSLEMVQPERKAFQKVANRYGLDYEDVEAIYIKVSSQLRGPAK